MTAPNRRQMLFISGTDLIRSVAQGIVSAGDLQTALLYPSYGRNVFWPQTPDFNFMPWRVEACCPDEEKAKKVLQVVRRALLDGEKAKPVRTEWPPQTGATNFFTLNSLLKTHSFKPYPQERGLYTRKDYKEIKAVLEGLNPGLELVMVGPDAAEKKNVGIHDDPPAQPVLFGARTTRQV